MYSWSLLGYLRGRCLQVSCLLLQLHSLEYAAKIHCLKRAKKDDDKVLEKFQMHLKKNKVDNIKGDLEVFHGTNEGMNRNFCSFLWATMMSLDRQEHYMLKSMHLLLLCHLHWKVKCMKQIMAKCG